MVEYDEPGLVNQRSIASADAVMDLSIMLYKGASQLQVEDEAVVNSNKAMVQAMS